MLNDLPVNIGRMERLGNRWLFRPEFCALRLWQRRSISKLHSQDLLAKEGLETCRDRFRGKWGYDGLMHADRYVNLSLALSLGRPTRQAVGPWWSRQIHGSRLDLTADSWLPRISASGAEFNSAARSIASFVSIPENEGG